MGIGGGGDSSDSDLEAVLEVSAKAVRGISDILFNFRKEYEKMDFFTIYILVKDEVGK